jgi:hypothetical protein
LPIDEDLGRVWFAAELRMRTERADGFHYNASWHRGGNTYLDTSRPRR